MTVKDPAVIVCAANRMAASSPPTPCHSPRTRARNTLCRPLNSRMIRERSFARSMRLANPRGAASPRSSRDLWLRVSTSGGTASRAGAVSLAVGDGTSRDSKSGCGADACPCVVCDCAMMRACESNRLIGHAKGSSHAHAARGSSKSTSTRSPLVEFDFVRIASKASASIRMRSNPAAKPPLSVDRTTPHHRRGTSGFPVGRRDWPACSRARRGAQFLGQANRRLPVSNTTSPGSCPCP